MAIFLNTLLTFSFGISNSNSVSTLDTFLFSSNSFKYSTISSQLGQPSTGGFGHNSKFNPIILFSDNAFVAPLRRFNSPPSMSAHIKSCHKCCK